MQLHPPGAETLVRTQPVRGVPGAAMLMARGQVAVDVELPGIRKDLAHVMRGGHGDVDPFAHAQLVVLDHARIHHVPHGHGDDGVHAQALHEEAVRHVDPVGGEVLSLGVALGEQGIRFGLDSGVEVGLGRHGVDYEAERIAEVHAGNQGRGKGEEQVGLREKLRVAGVQAEVIVHEVPREVRPLGGGMDALDPLHQGVQGFRPASHARGVQHESGQELGDVHAEGPFLVGHQVVHEVLGVDAEEQGRELGVHHPPAHGRGAVGVPNRQARHVLAPLIVELVQLLSQPRAGKGRGQGLAKPEVIGAVQGGQDAGRAVDLLEVAEVVPASQVHAPALVHPAVCLESGQEDHGLREGRADLEHRTVLLRKAPEERVQVAVSNMRVHHQLGQRNRRDLPGKGGTLKGRAGEVLRDRSGQGAADQVHLADELDALFRLVVKFEYEAKDVARIDEADNDDISRIGNLVGEDDPADTRLYELARSALLRPAVQFPMPNSRSQRPEIAVVVFQDLQVNQAIQNRIDDRLRTGSEPFNPVLGVPLNRFGCNFFKDGVQGRVACFRRVHEEQGFHVRVDARSE